MSTTNSLSEILQDIERTMREFALWQATPPEKQAFASTTPFCIDTMSAEQWLQWVFIPRMHALLLHGVALPSGCSVTAYFEETLSQSQPRRSILLAQLQRIDEQINKEST